MRFLPNVVFSILLTALVGAFVQGVMLAAVKTVEQAQMTMAMRIGGKPADR